MQVQSYEYHWQWKLYRHSFVWRRVNLLQENGRKSIKLLTLIRSFLSKYNWNSQYFTQHSGYELLCVPSLSTLKLWKIRYNDKVLDFYSGESELDCRAGHLLYYWGNRGFPQSLKAYCNNTSVAATAAFFHICSIWTVISHLTQFDSINSPRYCRHRIKPYSI
jgi:hypothetical protein